MKALFSQTCLRHRVLVLGGTVALVCSLFWGMSKVEVSAEPIADLKKIISKLQSRYEDVRELESDFTHTTHFQGFSTKSVSKGKFYLKREKLRWDYLEPSQQQIFVLGDIVFFYVPEHQQVIKTRLSVELDSQVPVRLLAGTSHLEKEFHIRWTDVANRQDAQGAYLLTLIPKNPSPGLTEIGIAVDPKDFLIRRIMLLEEGGNRAEFEFSRIEFNRGLKDKFFIFDIPKGVTVVEQP